MPELTRISSLSTKWVHTSWPSTADPTDATPQFAFTTGGDEPTDDDWHDGEWASDPAPGAVMIDQVTVDVVFTLARILVGPAAAVDWPVAEGADPTRVTGWARVVTDDDAPVEQIGSWTVT